MIDGNVAVKADSQQQVIHFELHTVSGEYVRHLFSMPAVDARLFAVKVELAALETIHTRPRYEPS